MRTATVQAPKRWYHLNNSQVDLTQIVSVSAPMLKGSISGSAIELRLRSGDEVSIGSPEIGILDADAATKLLGPNFKRDLELASRNPVLIDVFNQVAQLGAAVLGVSSVTYVYHSVEGNLHKAAAVQLTYAGGAKLDVTLAYHDDIKVQAYSRQEVARLNNQIDTVAAELRQQIIDLI